jgi:hypothetical protein
METCGPFAAVIKQKSQEKLQGSQRPHPFTLINKNSLSLAINQRPCQETMPNKTI